MISKLSELRKGTPISKVVTLYDGLKVAVVLLSTDVMLQIEREVQQYMTDNEKSVNNIIKNQLFDIKLCYHAMRDPSDINTKIASNEDEVAKLLDSEDVSRITTAFGELMVNKTPKIELMSEEDFEELKKTLGAMELKELSTVSLVHLTNFHQTLLS